MKEFDYSLDYKNMMFDPNDKRYRIGRGEQGVLLVRPYTDDICKYWRFKTPEDAIISSTRILFMYHSYKDKKDFVGMDMCRKFLEMGFIEREDMLITKMVRNTKTVKYYHKRKTH